MALPRPSATTTALITGASSGLGREFALQLAALGHHVTVVARRGELLDTLADELNAGDAPGGVSVVVADLTQSSQRQLLLDALLEAGRTPSILINNAGFSTTGAAAKADPEREVAMVRTNVEAVVALTVAVLPAMVVAREGAILNVASTASFQPLPGQAGYGASKAFVLSYTEAISAEVSQFGIAVTALCPGPVATGFAEAAGFSEEEAGIMPKFLWVSPHDVVRAGIEGLVASKRVVIPGTANNVLAHVARHSPRGPLLGALKKYHPSL